MNHVSPSHKQTIAAVSCAAQTSAGDGLRRALHVPGAVREQLDERELCRELLEGGLIGVNTVKAALTSRQRTGKRLGTVLLSGCHLSPEAMRVVLDHRAAAPQVTLDDTPLDEDAREILPLELAARHHCVPFAWSGGELRVAFEQAPDERSLQQLEAACAHRISPYLASAFAIRAHTVRLYETRPRRRARLAVHLRPQPMLLGANSADPAAWRLLGQMLLDRRLITPEILDTALTVQARTGQRLGTILIAGRFLSERALLDVLSEQMRVPAVTLTGRPVDDNARDLLTLDVCVAHGCVPFELARGLLHVAFQDSPTERSLLELESACDVRVEPHLANPADVESYREQMYGKIRRHDTPRFSRFDTCTSNFRAIREFADVMLARDLVSDTQMDAALSVQMRTRQRLATVLLTGAELSPRAMLAVLNEPQQVAETTLVGLAVDSTLAQALARISPAATVASRSPTNLR